MNNLTLSFNSLVKSNNGFFKSEKQAAFLLSKCLNSVFFGESTQTYKHITRREFLCDSKGVVKVFNYSQTKKTLTLVWERQSDDTFQVANDLRIKKEQAFKRLNSLRDRIQQLSTVQESLSDWVVSQAMKGATADQLVQTKQLKLMNKVVAHIANLDQKWNTIESNC